MDDTIVIPRRLYESLLQTYYFARACKECDIEHTWDRYHEVEVLYNQYAVNDIMKENKDAE